MWVKHSKCRAPASVIYEYIDIDYSMEKDHQKSKHVASLASYGRLFHSGIEILSTAGLY